jgi:hypothetical protein
MNDQAIAAIREYLEALEWLMGQTARMPSGAQSPHRFLLDQGRAFRVGSNTYQGRRDPPKQCFANAGRRALKPGTDLLYAEGYTTSVGYVAIPHAWLVTPAGEVIDTTLRGGDEEYGERGYFGLAFTREYLAKSILKTETWGLLHTEMMEPPAFHDIALGNTAGMLAEIETRSIEELLQIADDKHAAQMADLTPEDER